jgi:glyoxylase-like metal-dependent hydrolase (beta-lactamase superfamily II)
LPRPEYAKLERVPSPSRWFEVYKVDSGVLAIYEPHQWEEVISYLILGRQRALLLDTGMGMGDMRTLVSELTDLPVEVLNTHTHGDHIGDNWQFDRVLALNTAYTHLHAAKGWTHAQEASEVAPGAFCGAPPKGLDTAAFFVRPFDITDTVADGSIIDLGERQLEVLHIPGHAPDALALLDGTRSALYTGDTYYDGSLYVLDPQADLATYARSADRLAEIRPRLRVLHPSHNLPISDPENLIRMRDALHAILAGTAHGTLKNEITTYTVDGVTILVRKGSHT